MARRYFDQVKGTVGTDGVTSSATTLPLAAALTSKGASVVLASGDTMLLSFFDGTGALTEIMEVQGPVAAGATSVTVKRGQQGTTATAQAAGVGFKHALVASDLTAEAWHTVGATGEPAFQNSWINYGSDWQPLQFRKDALGYVEVRGSIKNGSPGTTVFVLPVGYRPAATHLIAIGTLSSSSGWVPGTAGYNGSGQVNVNTTGGQLTSLDGIRFLAEQ